MNSNQKNINKTAPKHVGVKILKNCGGKKTILKAVKEKKMNFMGKVRKRRIKTDVLSETVQIGRQWGDTSQILEEKPVKLESCI